VNKTNRLGAGALVALASTSLSACGILARVERPEPDRLARWQALPLPPDPALAAKALAGNGPCLMDDPGDNVVEPVPVVLVQDRRTVDSAAFLVQSPNHFGSCTITRASGMSGGGYGPPLAALEGPLSIDDQGSGTLGDGMANELGGRIGIPAARVIVQLDDGTVVTASVANGFWLTWWPLNATARRVVALDGTGAELASLAVTNP
jgi:hypothetical protein